MKKILTVMLVALLALAPMALAAGSTEAGTITFTKSYVSSGEAAGTYPAETLTFTIEADEDNPDGGEALITVGTDNTWTIDAIQDEITVNYPSYSKAGVYRYTITEVAGTTQGVTYHTDDVVAVAILVSFDEDGQLQVETEGVEIIEGEKNGDISNEYDLGGNPPPPDGPGYDSLDVSKAISGNLADPDKYFTVHVSFAAEGPVLSTITYEGGTDVSGSIEPADWSKGEVTVDIQLKGGETVHFYMIPDGVTYKVEEDASHLAAGRTPTDAELNSEEGYLATYVGDEGTIKTKETKTCDITNTKEKEVPTGINMTTLPYFLILALVAVGAMMMIIRRRNAAQD